MADRELAIVFRVVNDQLVSGIQQAEGAIKNFATNSLSAIDQVEERTENLRHLWTGMFEAFVGIEIIDVLKGIAEAANTAAEKLEIAANTAKNFGHSLDPNAMESWLRQFAGSVQGGGFKLPDMREAVQRFAAIGLDSDQIKRATADVANLAATFGFDFPQAIQITQEALTGHVEMLTRYGVISREAAKNIHTVEEAMQALEKASAGGAEKRADGLAGAFGRLGNSVSTLAESFGHYLIPYFDATSNALANIANAFSSLPPWLQQAAAGISFLSLSLTALGLLLPAVKLGIEFLVGGFGLLRAILATLVGSFGGVSIAAAATSDVMAALAAKQITAAEASELLQASSVRSAGALGLLQTFIVGPLFSAFGGLVSILRTVITAIGVDLVGADAAAAASFAAVISPALAVIAIIAGIIAAAIALSGHWNDVMKGLSTAWDEFYNNVILKANTLKRVLADIALALNPTTSVVGGQMLGADLAGAMPKTASWVDHGVASATNAIVNAVKSAWSKVVDFFNSPTSHIAIPKDKFQGVIPGKGKGAKDTSSKVAENALKNFDESTKNWLEAFQARVDVAQAMVDSSKAKLDEYTATLPGGKPQTAEQEAKYQALLNDQLKAEQNLRAATLEQHQANVETAARYEQIAAAISPHLKNHDQLMRQALDAARQHNTEALRLWTTYQNLGVTLAQIAATQRNMRDQAIEDRADNLVQQGRLGYDTRQNSRDAQIEVIDNAKAQATIAHGGTLPKIQDDQYAIQLAKIADAAAQDYEALLKHAAAIAEDTAKQTGLKADRDKAAQAENAATTATNARVAADNHLNQAIEQFTKDVTQRKTQLGLALDELVKKLNIPGLAPNAQTGGFSFNPMQFLLQAFEQTKAFADVMATVNQIVRVFVQVLDSLRPVIDALLAVVRAVANVFIFLYDTVARILSLLGIHLRIIQSLNAAYGNIPLIQITHNIPTLNELAAGKLNSPLSNTPQDYQSLQDIGNTHTSLLQSILGAIIALGIIERMTGIGGHGGIGGILGPILGLFGHGATSGASAGTTAGPSLTDAYNALQTLPPDTIAQGTQSALVADGNSTSGGLFTSTNNALQAAAPALATAIGGVIGSMIGGGGGGMSSLLGGVGGIVGTIFGGPVGGAIGGFLGGILGGLFGHHHKSAPAATTQTSEFTAMLNAATDVHAWMNGLTTQAATMLQTVSTAAGAFTTAAQGIAAAAQAMSSNNFNLSHQTNIGNVHLNNDLDVANLGEKMAVASMRMIRTKQFSIARVPIG